MTYEEKLLEIELERLEMEKRRDKCATLRFMFGTVLLAMCQQEPRCISVTSASSPWKEPIGAT